MSGWKSANEISAFKVRLDLWAIEQDERPYSEWDSKNHTRTATGDTADNCCGHCSRTLFKILQMIGTHDHDGVHHDEQNAGSQTMV